MVKIIVHVIPQNLKMILEILSSRVVTAGQDQWKRPVASLWDKSY